LLTASLADLLPPDILAQRKRTFTLPWEQWLRGPLRTRLAASFAEPAPALIACLKPNALLSVWNDFLSGKTTWSRPWALYVLNEWCRSHLSHST
jgi:asparagine synthase (glutamine-hydrolysing)